MDLLGIGRAWLFTLMYYQSADGVRHSVRQGIIVEVDDTLAPGHSS